MLSALTSTPALLRSPVLWGIVGALFAWSVVNRLRRAYGTTLRRVPGPWHAKFTDMGLLAHELAGTRFWYVQSLHRKYGPIVRMTPDEVAISDPKIVSRVHGIGTEFRKRHQPRTPLNIFSMSEAKPHRIRRRFYAKAFADDTISSSTEPAVRQLSLAAMAHMRRESMEDKDGLADLYKWCLLFGNDASYEVVFGNALTEGAMANNGTIDDLIIGAHLQRMIAWLRFCFPIFLLGRWFAFLSPTLRDLFHVEWRYAPLLESGQKQRDMAARTVFAKNSTYSREDGVYNLSKDVKMNEIDVAHDCTTFLGAGGEALGVTLVYLVWQILRIPDLQAEIEAEVASISEPLTNTNTTQLPVLEAVIYETLRLYGGGGSFLPRFAPTPAELGGYVIPAGTAVTTHHAALHRNPAAWVEPEKFDHRRWLSPSQSKALTQDNFQPFSAGARNCIAMHLVMIELRLFAATFFREFRGAKLAPSTTDESMKIQDRFHIGPIARTCKIIPPGEA